MARPDPASLDFRFSDECPACGRAAGWTGDTEERDGRVFLAMACPHCGNRFDELDPAWEKRFRASPAPTHRPGAR